MKGHLFLKVKHLDFFQSTYDCYYFIILFYFILKEKNQILPLKMQNQNMI